MPAAWFPNGPNAKLYGFDAKGVYGRESWPQLRKRCLGVAAAHGLDLDMRQTNDEGELVIWIQQARSEAQGLPINAAGLSCTSVAVLDALLLFEGPVLEVHRSNIYRREPFRERTFTSKDAKGGIFGLGALGCELAGVVVTRLLSDDGAALLFRA